MIYKFDIGKQDIIISKHKNHFKTNRYTSRCKNIINILKTTPRQIKIIQDVKTALTF